MKNKEIRLLIMLVVLNLSAIFVCLWDYTHRKPLETEECIEESEDLIRWKDDVEDISIEHMELEVVENAETGVDKSEELKSLGIFKLTAYCSCERCSGHWGNMTSTGTVAQEGRTVAADPKVIPYGTVLIIDGHENEYLVEDCGSGIKGKEIDVFIDDHERAREFGVQYKEIFEKESN